MLCQEIRNLPTQVRKHRTHGTQNIQRLRQDATPADQTQAPFLLMFIPRSISHSEPPQQPQLSHHKYPKYCHLYTPRIHRYGAE